MPRKKNYVSVLTNGQQYESAPVADGLRSATPPSALRASADIDIDAVIGPTRRKSGGRKKILFSDWLNRGVDSWVWASVDALTSELAAGEREVSTIYAFAEGLKNFFEFLIDGRERPIVLLPQDIQVLHTTQYVGWLQGRAVSAGKEPAKQRTPYKATKSGLTSLHRYGAIKGDVRRLFPPNPFAGSGSGQGAEPLSDAEQQRVADALRADLTGLHHQRLQLNTAQAATVHYLIVAMRVGGSSTPILEVERDALRPGLLPGTMRLEFLKYRAHKTVQRALRDGGAPTEESSSEVIPMDAVAVFRRMLTVSASLVDDAPPRLKNSVWLYRSERRGIDHHGLVSCLSVSSLHRNIRLLVKRHGLLSDQGQPLQLTTQRLRASLSHRAWRLSDGDPFAVAGILGNTARVVGTNYLSINETLKGEAASFIGQDLTVLLRGTRTKGIVIPIAREEPPNLTAIPTARCGDTLHGERAPKDGTTHCRSFLLCLSCKSFVVVAEVDDLWRLLSFQQYLRTEEAHLSDVHGNGRSESSEVDDLRRYLRRAIEFIDEFIGSRFEPKLARDARLKASERLHPFWDLEIRKARRLRTPPDGAVNHARPSSSPRPSAS